MLDVRAAAALFLVLALAACGADYRPGVSGARPVFNQNLPSNGQPEPPGARPR